MWPLTNLDKRNKKRPKKLTDIMSGNCEVIVICLINGHFEAIHRPDSGHIAWKTPIFIKSNLLS